MIMARIWSWYKNIPIIFSGICLPSVVQWWQMFLFPLIFVFFFLLISLSLNHSNDSRLNPMTLRITLIMKEEKNNQNSSPHLFFSPPFEIAKKKTSRFKTWMDCIIKISFKSDDSSEDSNWPGMKVIFFLFLSLLLLLKMDHSHRNRSSSSTLLWGKILRSSKKHLIVVNVFFLLPSYTHTHTHIHSFTFKLPILMQINLDSKSKKKEKNWLVLFVCLMVVVVVMVVGVKMNNLLLRIIKKNIQ